MQGLNLLCHNSSRSPERQTDERSAVDFFFLLNISWLCSFIDPFGLRAILLGCGTSARVANTRHRYSSNSHMAVGKEES